MKKSLLTLACVAFLIAACPVHAEGWKFPIFNPFKKDGNEAPPPAPRPPTGARPSSRPQVNEPSSFEFSQTPSLPKPSMPSLPKWELPSWNNNNNAPRPERQGPNAWQKFNNGARNFFSRTRDALMPWANREDEMVEPNPGFRVTGARTATRPERGDENKQNIFSGFFNQKPEQQQQQIESPNDFLSLPRPQY